MSSSVALENNKSFAVKNDRPRLPAERTHHLLSSRAVEQVYIFFIVAAAIFLFYLSCVRLLWFDELLSWYTEQVPGIPNLLRLQANFPVSLDPPLYHLLGHALLAAGVSESLAVRFPSLAGSFVLLSAIYLFARRLAGWYVAALTVSCLLLTESFHMVEARPYGLLFGCAACSLLCWQQLVRDLNRSIALIGICASLFFAISIHYFGVLLPLPFLILLAYSTLFHRSVEIDLWTAILASYTAVFSWIPFLSGAKSYKTHYYIHTSLRDVFWAYILPLKLTFNIQNVALECSLFLFVAGLLIASLRFGYGRLRTPQSSPMEWAAVALLAALPIAGVALSFVTAGAFESRYVVEFTIGVAVAAACAAALCVQSKPARMLLLVAVVFLTCLSFIRYAWKARVEIVNLNACSVLAYSSGPLAVTREEKFLQLLQYRGLEQTSRNGSPSIFWVADLAKEFKFMGDDNVDRTIKNLNHWRPVPVETYESFRNNQQSQAKLLDAPGSRPPGWLGRQLAADNVMVQGVNRAGGCQVSRLVQSNIQSLDGPAAVKK